MVYADGSNPSVRKDIGVRLPSPALLSASRLPGDPHGAARSNAVVESAFRLGLCAPRVSGIFGWTAGDPRRLGAHGLCHVAGAVARSPSNRQLLRGRGGGPRHDSYRQPGASDQARRNTTKQDPAGWAIASGAADEHVDVVRAQRSQRLHDRSLEEDGFAASSSGGTPAAAKSSAVRKESRAMSKNACSSVLPTR